MKEISDKGQKSHSKADTAIKRSKLLLMCNLQYVDYDFGTSAINCYSTNRFPVCACKGVRAVVFVCLEVNSR